MANVKYFTTINGQPVEIAGIQPDVMPGVGRFSEKKYGTAAIPSESHRVVINGKSQPASAVGEFTYRYLGMLDGKIYEVDRVIIRKSNPSNHKCDARCRNAKGNNCECSCGGKFHGAGDL